MFCSLGLCKECLKVHSVMFCHESYKTKNVRFQISLHEAYSMTHPDQLPRGTGADSHVWVLIKCGDERQPPIHLSGPRLSGGGLDMFLAIILRIQDFGNWETRSTCFSFASGMLTQKKKSFSVKNIVLCCFLIHLRGGGSLIYSPPVTDFSALDQ